jgi:hypothetical protein
VFFFRKLLFTLGRTESGLTKTISVLRKFPKILAVPCHYRILVCGQWMIFVKPASFKHRSKFFGEFKEVKMFCYETEEKKIPRFIREFLKNKSPASY